jgi:hypothetical protein
MNGTFTATDGAQVTIHTHTAPEEGTTIQPLQNYFLYPGNR